MVFEPFLAGMSAAADFRRRRPFFVTPSAAGRYPAYTGVGVGSSGHSIFVSNAGKVLKIC